MKTKAQLQKDIERLSIQVEDLKKENEILSEFKRRKKEKDLGFVYYQLDCSNVIKIKIEKKTNNRIKLEQRNWVGIDRLDRRWSSYFTTLENALVARAKRIEEKIKNLKEILEEAKTLYKNVPQYNTEMREKCK